MKQCAIGIRVHSGWGAVVVVSGEANTLEVILRRRIEIIDPKAPGTFQPYHFARDLKLPSAEKHIAESAAASLRLATAALRTLIDELHLLAYRVTAAVILLSSGRPLPELRMILASHPMIHTAEGEFFRRAFRDACAGLKIPVAGIRERDLDERAKAALGRHAVLVKKTISSAGKILGPPWTTDQKAAALAAALALGNHRLRSLQQQGFSGRSNQGFTQGVILKSRSRAPCIESHKEVNHVRCNWCDRQYRARGREASAGRGRKGSRHRTER